MKNLLFILRFFSHHLTLPQLLEYEKTHPSGRGRVEIQGAERPGTAMSAGVSANLGPLLERFWHIIGRG